MFTRMHDPELYCMYPTLGFQVAATLSRDSECDVFSMSWILYPVRLTCEHTFFNPSHLLAPFHWVPDPNSSSNPRLDLQIVNICTMSVDKYIQFEITENQSQSKFQCKSKTCVDLRRLANLFSQGLTDCHWVLLLTAFRTDIIGRTKFDWASPYENSLYFIPIFSLF